MAGEQIFVPAAEVQDARRAAALGAMHEKYYNGGGWLLPTEEAAQRCRGG